ncbi:DUF6095 family protein [Winogradskyella vincentii]|uniref:DUF6095 family protein n=1 Tax=Winogradskyella vincentii TaxID=2877122 RepID=A0ABS7Y0F1_9FLAO|nr:DUF6095 family protein [Winogradskyella vincentii]MCA0152730.1 DUF6095 family protein [Winogradskyella vincentii]
MEENNRTDKEILTKGIKRLIICLLLMFAGPTLLHISFSNDDKPLFIPLLIVSLIICIMAIFFLFSGINTIINSMFQSKK